MHAGSDNYKHLTLVIDQGSHASRLALFSETGQLVLLETENISTHSDKEGWYEQDANKILSSVQQLLKKLQPAQISKIGNFSLCTQRSSIVAWHRKTGQALSPAISWRDLRNLPLIDTLKSEEQTIRRITGLALSGHYSASKMRWLLLHNKNVTQAAAENQLCIAPLASFLIFHLLKGRPFVIDHSNAQRCQLFDITTLNWSDQLLKLFHIKKASLPKCHPVIHHYGELEDLNIPLTAVCGDQNAALHAYPSLGNETALVNIGTGAFVLSQSIESKSPPRLLRSIANSNDYHANYITEGTVNGAGASLSWAIERSSKTSQTSIKKLTAEVFDKLPQWLSEITYPPIFINTIAGLGSPWWCNAGQARFLSDRDITPADQYVAIIESIIFLVFNNIQQLTTIPGTLYISGGLSQLDGLCQKLADLTQSKVLRFVESESSARGCAWLANQLTKSTTSQWQSLNIERQFIPLENQNLINRYQQFVGELKKRCHND